MLEGEVSTVRGRGGVSSRDEEFTEGGDARRGDESAGRGTATGLEYAFGGV